MDKPHESMCPYAVLCRVPSSARASAPQELQSSSNELLVAIATHQLHVFARKSDRVSPSCCSCDDTPLRKHGFLCPHVTSYDDFGHHLLTIPLNAITQISMTYRTATVASSSAATPSSSTATSTQNKSVATRTKDLVLSVCHGKLLLWLEFEHNLARGWFLEALTAGSSSSTNSIDVDYVDLSDTSALDQLLYPHPASNGSRTTITAKDFAPQRHPQSLHFLRDAWRHIVYDKIKLALQIAHDNPIAIDCESEPIVACLLTCAMELSTRLDEPDLDAFTWLTSAFLNMHSLSKTKQDLALSQVLHSLDLGRLNSLELLSCLALQCAGDFYLQPHQCDVDKARPVLTEAARLVTISATCGAMEPALKMQLHATLRDLAAVHGDTLVPRPPGDRKPAFVQRANSTMSSLALAVSNKRELYGGGALRGGSSSSLLDKNHKTKPTFSLYAHVFGSGASVSGTSRRGSGGNSSGIISGSDPVMARLLYRVNKTLADSTGSSSNSNSSCFVDVLGAHGVRKARFRVFYDAQSTIVWLQDHIQRRFELVLQSSLDEELHIPSIPGPVRVELFYDPQCKQLVPLLGTQRLSQWIPQSADSTYELHAKLANTVVSSHRSTDTTPAILTQPRVQVADQTPPSLLCSLCGKRILLELVEDHSETCF